MDSYQFTATQDWFSHNIEQWTALFPLVCSEHPRLLEIGSWEGRSAVFLLNNLCQHGGEIVRIDHFDLFHTEAGCQRFERVKHNLALTGKKSRVLSQFSVPALMSILTEEMGGSEPGFDWIYVDGSHEADDTMLDGELVWRLARKGAIVIFDDYHWDKEPEESMHHPKRGIDAFLSLHQGEYERLTAPSHYQVVLRKITDMRIGFLVDNAGQGLDEALGYGINVALTVDSAYALGAAVTIRSIAETTPGRITVYVIDCGLSLEDRIRLQRTVEEYSNMTMVLTELQEDSLARKMGAEWAKLDMLDTLPVERVLYLDADTLVRRSLKELWDTDLQGKPLGAATDVGHPMGHEEIDRRPYFNAGVLLLDLAQVRLGTEDLRRTGKQMKDAKFRDQDALNVHFAGVWTVFGLEWNAQGLGTYARHPSDDRKPLALELERMTDPAIVHFTGPVHPTLVEVLNPYVQPPTAKPWGYLGAPSHPFQRDWHAMFGRTAWKGVESSISCEDEMQRAVEIAARDFEARVKELSESKP